MFIETSAKTKAGIQQAFEEIVQKVFKQIFLLYVREVLGANQLIAGKLRLWIDKKLILNKDKTL